MGPRRLLVCEGESDKAFFENLIKVRSLPNFLVRKAAPRGDKGGGNSRFSDALNNFKLEYSNFKSLTDVILVADNDDSPELSFQSVCEHLERIFGRDAVPNAPLERTTGRPGCSVLMIPWANEPGNLECLCIAAARNENRLTGQNIDHFLAVQQIDRWPMPRQGKAWLRTNLAVRCQKNPFVNLKDVFSDRRFESLIPFTDSSFDGISNFLASFLES